MSASTLQDRAGTVTWPRMRPRFTVEVSCQPNHVMQALRADVRASERGIESHCSDHHAVLSVPEDERQFWSTQLGIAVEGTSRDADDARRPTRVLGVFSPHPDVWTAYVFAIGTVVAVSVFSAMYAIVQLTMGHAPSALLVSLIAILVGGLVYTSTLVGQGLAAGEMHQLRSYLEDRLDEAKRLAANEPRTAIDSAQL
jgi:hypothetical protein